MKGKTPKEISELFFIYTFQKEKIYLLKTIPAHRLIGNSPEHEHLKKISSSLESALPNLQNNPWYQIIKFPIALNYLSIIARGINLDYVKEQLIIFLETEQQLILEGRGNNVYMLQGFSKEKETTIAISKEKKSILDGHIKELITLRLKNIFSRKETGELGKFIVAYSAIKKNLAGLINLLLKALYNQIKQCNYSDCIPLLQQFAEIKDTILRFEEYIDPNIPTKIEPFINNDVLQEFYRISKLIPWIEGKRITLTRLPPFKERSIEFKTPLELNRLTIFVGKNNSGKTRALKSIWRFVHSPSCQGYETTPQGRIIQTELKFFYIPGTRVLGSQISQIQPRPKVIAVFLEVCEQLSHSQYVEKNGVWDIPRLAHLLDLLTFKEDSADPEDRVPENQIDAFQEGQQVYDRFNDTIKRFFPGIILSRIHRLKNPEVVYNAMDADVPLDWHDLGSGTQQLLNLVLICEILKAFPRLFFRGIQPNAPPQCLLFIDEPEVSLHPSLQRAFFNFLEDASKEIQIIVATHSIFHTHPGPEVLLYLLRKTNDPTPEITKIDSHNYLQVHDEMCEPNISQTAEIMTKNNFEVFRDKVPNEEQPNSFRWTLQRIPKYMDTAISEYFNNLCANSDEVKNQILLLGTFEEQSFPLARNRYNLAFLRAILTPHRIDLNGGPSKPTSLRQIFLCPLNELDKANLPKDQLEKLRGRGTRFQALCHNIWDGNSFEKDNIVKYTDSQAKSKHDEVQEILKLIRNLYLQPGKRKENSLIVFPENTLPYVALNDLINFSKDHHIIIIGGMEHISLDDWKKVRSNFQGPISTLFVQGEEISPQARLDQLYINQCLIVNSNGKFSFQVKNTPVYLGPEDIEGIPVVCPPKFIEFDTAIGRLSILICKDYLMHHNVIPIWLEREAISTLVIPAFTDKVSPFLNKLGEIPQQPGQSVVFCSLGEYGGSWVYNEKTRNPEPKNLPQSKSHYSPNESETSKSNVDQNTILLLEKDENSLWRRSPDCLIHYNLTPIDFSKRPYGS